MKTIQITPYNYITIHHQDSNEVVFSWQDGRKHRAKVRQDQQGEKYFNTNKLQIPLKYGYKIKAYVRGAINGAEYWQTELNGCRPFESIIEAENFIKAGGLEQYTYKPLKWEIVEY